MVDIESVVLGDSIVLEIIFGSDGISSLGFQVVVDCEPAETVPPPTVLPATQVPTAPAASLPPSPPAEALISHPGLHGVTSGSAGLSRPSDGWGVGRWRPLPSPA